MSKLAKELIIVVLSGAGAMFALWGAFATKMVATTTVHYYDWKTIGIGLGLIVVAAVIGFLVRPKATT